MNENIFLIFFFVFVVLPILRKIGETLVGGGGGEKRPSREEVREYLKRMREGSNQKRSSRPLYNAPATTSYEEEEEYPEAVYDSGPDKFNRIAKAVEEDIHSRGNYDRIEKSVSDHMDGDVGSISAYGQTEDDDMRPGELLDKAIFNNSEMTNVEKAVILSEIFKRPEY